VVAIMGIKKRNEQGQVLVLLTVGIITLLGFTALAIDGGRLYSERRNVQGTTDTSALTGALYIAQQLKDGVDAGDIAAAEAAAYQRAENNGYDASLTNVEIITSDPNYYFVRTTIHTTIPPTIVQIVYDGPLKVAATSEARVPKSTVFALGQALFSINSSACNSLWFHGTGALNVKNSGVFSNSDCESYAVNFQGDPDADIDGNIISVGGVQLDDGVTSGGELPGDQVDFQKFNEPDCSKLSNKSGGGSTFTPGIYNGINLSGGGNWTFEEGLYCLDGDLRIQNGAAFGDGVTFYMRNGAVTINGGDNTFKAPYNDIWKDGKDQHWNGMVFFFAQNNTDDFTLAGNGDTLIEGTIYNYGGDCELAGTGGSIALNSQIVCNTIEVTGTSDIDITYDPSKNFKPPTTIDLVE